MKYIIPFLVLFGCDLDSDKASDLQDEANRAQTEAGEKIADARTEAAETISDARLELSEEARQAQAEADRTVAGAQGDFRALRETYRHEKSKALIELDTRIAELEAKALTANGEEKARREPALRQIAQLRADFVAAYDGLETVDAAQWDTERDRVERLWDAFQMAVRKA
jgi:hypothetical protein